MSRLVIEYVFEGHRRGYNFTSPTDGYDDDVLKAIWRYAMPRGQGWGAEVYGGARSIKCFALNYGEVAVSEVTVTSLEDENGRRGIRRAVVDVMSANVFAHHLRSRLDGYPAEVRMVANEKYAYVQRNFPRLKKDKSLILGHTFTTPQDWWVMEALVLKLVIKPLKQMQHWEGFVPFTTLALDYHNSSRVVALPADKTSDIAKNPVVHLD